LSTVIDEAGSFFKIWKCEHRKGDGVVWHTDYSLVATPRCFVSQYYSIETVLSIFALLASEEKSKLEESKTARARVVSAFFA
jgi:hypothetical protein